MLNAPLISFATLTPGGITHVVEVHSNETALYLITEDASMTDAVNPAARLSDTVDVPIVDSNAAPKTSEFTAFAHLPSAALRLMAGHRALEAHLKFQAGYLPFEAWLNIDDDDDLNLDEGVFL